VRQVIRKDCFIAVNPNGCIDIEILAILALKVEDAVVSEDPEASDLYFVLHRSILSLS
jgi:hypothetical protein